MTEKQATDKKQVEDDEKKGAKFPEFPPVKPDDAAGMTHEQKLKLIEKEAQTLYDFCLEKGLSKKDLSWCLKPLFGSPPEYVKKVIKDNSSFCLTLAVLFGIISVFVGWTPAYNQFCIHGKLALMKVLPYYDWTYLYEKDCLVKNPYVAPTPNITKEECGACFDVKKNGIEALSNVSLDMIANDFLLSDFPAIIEDGIKGWPDPDISLPFLENQYKMHKDLDNVGDCRFNSSVEDLNNVYDFFDAYGKGELSKPYFASWDNCDLKAAKHFRLHYKRPYFLPPMAEAAKTNTFLVAEGKHSEPAPLQIDEEASGIWLTVIQGELMIELLPIDGCADFKGCSAVKNTLKAGEAVLLPTRIWLLDVTPIAKGITVALGSTAQWDEAEPAPAAEEGEGDVDGPQGGATDSKEDDRDQRRDDDDKGQDRNEEPQGFDQGKDDDDQEPEKVDQKKS